MGKIKKEDRASHCVNCNKSFEEIKYHSVNMCQICYNRNKSKNYHLSKHKYSSCEGCGIKPGEPNKRGKIVSRLVRGYCNTCYYQRWAKGCKSCSKCGVEFLTTKASCLCDLCRPSPAHENVKIKKLKKGELLSRKNLTSEQLTLMLTLFRRYKNGTQNVVDHFRVADLYLEVFEGHPFVYNSMLDSYNEQSQVVLMLRQLKSVYDNVEPIKK